MGCLEGLTFDEAIKEAKAARKAGLVGVCIFHRHEYNMIEADEGCYVVFSYTKSELAEMRREAETPDEPFAPLEIMRNYTDENGVQCGEVIFEADTIDALLKIALEQNKNEP